MRFESWMLVQFGAIALPAEMDASRVVAYEVEKGQLKEEVTFSRMISGKNHSAKRNAETRTIGRLARGKTWPLSPTRKQYLDTVKMIAYRVETALTGILRKTISRTEETRALLRKIFLSEADLLPDETAGTLTARPHHLPNHLSDEVA
jgi:hypothetical protein